MADHTALFRECRTALGFTQAALAAELLVGARAVRYWEGGDRQIPGPVWVALILMLEKHGSNRTLLRTLKELKRSPW